VSVIIAVIEVELLIMYRPPQHLTWDHKWTP